MMVPPTTSQTYGTAHDGADGPPCKLSDLAAWVAPNPAAELARVRWAEYGRLVYGL